MVVMFGLAVGLSRIVEVFAVKVKTAAEEFHAPAIVCRKVEACQVPRVRIRELVTVHAPVELTVSVWVDLLMVRVEKLSALTLAAVAPLRTTVLVEGVKVAGVKLAPTVMSSEAVAVREPAPVRLAPTVRLAPLVLHVPAVRVSAAVRVAAPLCW